MIPGNSIAGMQTLLLALMCNIARMSFCKKPSGISSSDPCEQKQKCFFVNAVVAFWKLQHLDLTISIKAQVSQICKVILQNIFLSLQFCQCFSLILSQVDLIVAIHDVLAEFGLCCVGEDGEGVDGTFLKLAIKHLLAMKLKSSHHTSNKQSNVFNDDMKMSADTEMSLAEAAASAEYGDLIVPDSLSPDESEQGKHIEDAPINMLFNGKEPSKQNSPVGSELAEDEREELDSLIDNALNQCFYCLYGLNLRSESGFEDDLAVHRNTSQADYQSKEQCADVFNYILPYAKASTVGFFLTPFLCSSYHLHLY